MQLDAARLYMPTVRLHYSIGAKRDPGARQRVTLSAPFGVARTRTHFPRYFMCRRVQHFFHAWIKSFFLLSQKLFWRETIITINEGLILKLNFYYFQKNKNMKTMQVIFFQARALNVNRKIVMKNNASRLKKKKAPRRGSLLQGLHVPALSHTRIYTINCVRAHIHAIC